MLMTGPPRSRPHRPSAGAAPHAPVRASTCPHPRPAPPRQRREGSTMKKLQVRKTGPVRLTGTAAPFYAAKLACGVLA
ncbi:hypothetical protein GCM10009738_58640 [Kitasatospora viridis]